MRYAIGVNIYDKKEGTSYDGLATIDSLGLYPSVLRIPKIQEYIDDGKEVTTIIYDDLESVQKKISEFSVHFRREGVWSKYQKWEKSKKIIRFYAVKVDSSKFPFKIGESSKKTKSGEKLQKYESRK